MRSVRPALSAGRRMKEEIAVDRKISQMFFGRSKPKKDGTYHSKGYHRYFDGYVERRTEDKNGKVRIERIYAGPYYAHALTDRQWTVCKVLYALLFCAAAALYLFAGTRPVPSNMVLYAVLPQVFAAVGLLWMLAVLVCYLFAARRMKLRTYRATVPVLKYTALFNTAALGASALLAALYAFTAEGAGTKEQNLCIALLFLAAAAMLALYLLERAMKYTEIPSELKLAPDEYKIER